MNTSATHIIPSSILFVLLTLSSIVCISSCSKEDKIVDEQNAEMVSEEESTPCANTTDFIFNEKDGLISAEFEKAKFADDWSMKSKGNSFSGKGYMVWEGSQQLHEPGTGSATFNLKITNSGTYRFVWKSAVKIGGNSTDHNDTWLRFGNADNFYAKNGNSIVYPKDSGKTPNPEGATKDGWFKVYRSGSDLDFKWNALTYDNNGHEIFIVFETPGIYLMEISARSSGHAIDKFVLFNESNTLQEATSNSELSAITCN